MGLSQTRVQMIGETPYAHEMDGIRFLQDHLPNHDPHYLWALFELVDPSSGRLLEIDALVMGYSALYLLELKARPGLYQGDTVDWQVTDETGVSRYMNPPYKQANFKAKVLKTLLGRHLDHAPWVQALVFLSAENVKLDFKNWGDLCVVTRKNVVDAIRKHEFPGADDHPRRRINAPMMRDIARALSELGIRKRKGKAMAGAYQLGPVIEEGTGPQGYQDRVATHEKHETVRARARIYLVPDQTSIERRKQLRRAADREFKLFHELREHSGVLQARDYVESPLGPTVLFDDFEGAVPLDTFLRQNPSLGFDDRIALVMEIARTVQLCHEKRIVHGALGPHAVLVRRHPENQKLETRLFNFQLGQSQSVTPTMHWSAHAASPWSLYQAPEMREDPSQRGPQSDIFSVGALAYLIVTGSPPASSVSELDRRLREHDELDPRVATDNVPEPVAAAVALATHRSPINRADDLGEWLILLEEQATAPEQAPPKPEVSPLEAQESDILREDLLVHGLLGYGASSRVLKVERDGRYYALKVSLGPDHDDRLKAEAEVLGRLEQGGAPIVRLIDDFELAGRRCLLLTLAGATTLHNYLTKKGTVSLDYASRYGEDLLRALEELEGAEVIHRDIKPANLGVGSATKGRQHLILFDFSLASSPLTATGVGTTAYRDPFLSSRGRWDTDADRWSAAVTLHEMLTGVLPQFAAPTGERTLPSDEDAELVIAAERFDAGVRDRLTKFFEQALAADVTARFPDATHMRKAWEACFAEPSVSTARVAPDATATGEARATESAEEPVLTDEQIATVTPDTPLGALPLTHRARNALDRAGLLYAQDLLDLPNNRLSLVRGVGAQVAREVHDFITRWKQLRPVTAPAREVFYPNYRGEDLVVTMVGLPTAVAVPLHDAGLHTLAGVANAPKQHVETLAHRHGFDSKTLREVLDRENGKANERAEPTTLEGWLDALWPNKRQKKRAEALALLFGLREPVLGRLDVTTREAAKHLGVTPANVSIMHAGAREAWQKHPAKPALVDMARAIVEESRAGLPLRRAAEAVLSWLPHDREGDAALLLARAAALLRIACDIERDEDGGLQLIRLGAEPWLFLSEAHATAVRTLAEVADKLAGRPVLAAAGEVTRRLSEAALGTPLEPLSAERLVEVAVLASQRAARSTRLEIYPRQMPAARALELTAVALPTQVDEAGLRDRVQKRYAEAQALPPRPELDALVKKHTKLLWSEQVGLYVRPGTAAAPTFATTTGTAAFTSTASARRLTAIDASTVSSEDFEERLKNAVERGAFRVLPVDLAHVDAAVVALSRRLGVEPVSLDRELIRRMKATNVKEELLHRTDREGPAADKWKNLVKVATSCAKELGQALVPAPEPLLLVEPGLVARYRLEGLLQQLVEGAKDDRSAAVFLVVPTRDVPGVPRINDQLIIPGVLPPQVLRVPMTWVHNHTTEAA